ncbi:hypothetical protein [Anaerotignum propionicum]|uniref:Uncharacterized protein n=1 Tax=Anaerotignum propionicum DSM 1682 TaxID=991789 RepID=A0A0X8VAC8_ANAPI|nr:hypothetical protein [Anaerotignum propionicum]AMJ40384.1 hypothetical protein CPRO_07830 [Anaerotignum propionicum DSM 1682]SHE43527.1 hypothetical protein SAMN02745151_00697 [[Clostridium] propionicum DSM 1682] [Anaerotignum propionicum DSM 1682]
MTTSYDGYIRIDTRLETSNFNKEISLIPSKLSKLKIAAGALGTVFAAAFTVKKIVEVGRQAISLASDLQEVQNVVNTAFGSMSDRCNEFAENAIESLGMSQLAAKQFASTYMAMGRGSGIAMKRAADMAIGATERIGDVASFYNKSFEEVDTMMKSIWTGETESLKQIGVVMTQSNLQQFAYTQGIKKKIATMSQAEMIQLRYAYVMQQTSLAQGDFLRTSDSWANQTRILSENWKEFLGILGSGLIKVLIPVVQFLNEVVKALVGIAKAVAAVYHMLAGESINDSTEDISGAVGNLAETSLDAAEGQEGLADGIKSASAAAKNALANFDDLDVLQNNLGGGLSGIGNFDIPDFAFDKGTLENTKSRVKDFTDDIKKLLVGLKNDVEDFVIQPVIAQPVIPKLPVPVYRPEWGLVPPGIPVPEFPPLPLPIYEPEWGLVPTLQQELGLVYGELTEFAFQLQYALEYALGNSQIVFDTAISNAAMAFANARINFGLTKDAMIANANAWISETSTGFQRWKQNISTAVYDTARNAIDNWNAALETTSINSAAWINSMSQNFVKWGEGMLKASWDAASGMANNMLSGFRTIWENFKELMSGIGESISTKWQENKSWLVPTLVIGAAVAVGAGLVLSGGTLAAPLAAGAAMAVPMLATGAVIPPNQEFLAVLGDQKSGRNLEAPEGLIRQIMREELAGLGATDGGSGTTVILELDKREIGRTFLPIIKKEESRVGVSLRVGGVL